MNLITHLRLIRDYLVYPLERRTEKGGVRRKRRGGKSEAERGKRAPTATHNTNADAMAKNRQREANKKPETRGKMKDRWVRSHPYKNITNDILENTTNIRQEY